MRRKKIWTSLVLSGAMIFGLTTYVSADEVDQTLRAKDAAKQERQVISYEFDDTNEAAWARGYIGKMQALDVIKGYTDGTFKPNKPVTQIEAIVMAVRLMGLEDEVQAKPQDVKLHFKDAKNVPHWAKRYVAVALENGLFAADDDKVQPQKAASRVWIVELLVKALGMEAEALDQMSDIPDFKDVDAIPAGAIGYVNAALKLGITTGYPDQTFGPNKPVTRGEMAAFLYRTNDERHEQAGATVVQGTIQAVNEDRSGDKENTRHITIRTYDGQQLHMFVANDLLVEYNTRFITADQLIVGDVITLVVQNGKVVDAVLVMEQAEQHQAVQQLIEFKLELEEDGREFELKYKNRNGKAFAEYELKNGRNKTKLTGSNAEQAVKEFLQKLTLDSGMSKQEIVEAVLAVSPFDSYDELEIEIRFANGKKVEIEREQDGRKTNKPADKRDKSEKTGGKQEIVVFKVEIELHNDTEAEWEYKLKKNGKAEAEIEIEGKKNKTKLQGKEAVERIEQILGNIVLSDNAGKDEIIRTVIAALGIEPGDIEEIEIEIKYANGKTFKIESE